MFLKNDPGFSSIFLLVDRDYLDLPSELIPVEMIEKYKIFHPLFEAVD